MNNNKIKLFLEQILKELVEEDEYTFEKIYLELYENVEKNFKFLFAYFHERLNVLFEFMNRKSKSNYHYNADASRELIRLINKLEEIENFLKKTNYAIIIKKKYKQQINYVKKFLQEYWGSTIPNDYKEFKIIKYEPIFSFKQKQYYTIKSNATFNNSNISIQINNDILKHISDLLESGHYFHAVEEAYKIVRKKLKEITGEEQAHKAFKEENLVLIFKKVPENELEKNFYEGVKFLHMAIQKLRNETAHRPAYEIDKNLALHYIVLASLSYDLISK